jgi:flagellar hook-basal body complex protein FliE
MTIGNVKLNGAINPGKLYTQNSGVNGNSGPSFANKLQDAMKSVESSQVNRDQTIDKMVTGEISEVHDVMIAAEEAQLAFEMMLEVRNKLLEAYTEVMRMQV